jgi:hypothetical protein
MSLLTAAVQDLEAILAAPDFGEYIIITPHDHPAFTLRGLFEVPALALQPDKNLKILSTGPLLHLSQVQLDAALGRWLNRQDRLTVQGQDYQLQEPQPDGAGLLTLRLKKLGHPAPMVPL